MLTFNCEKCNHVYKIDEIHSGKPMRCKQCGHITTVPLSSGASFGYFPEVPYKADGLTPDFDKLFAALAHEERTAPPLAN